MDPFRVIKHPLDEFSFSGDIGGLNQEGRNALDLIMLMIGDMRFRKGNISSTCARYFLLIDATWVPKLCFFAHINCTKMRDYLWHCELGEGDGLERLSENSQIALLFPEQEKQRGRIQDLMLGDRSDCSTEAEQEHFQMASIMRRPRTALR
jgi:hypothetical protein